MHPRRLSTLLSKRQQLGQIAAAIDALQKRKDADLKECVRVIQSCARLGALAEGRRIHQLIRRVGLGSDVYVSNHLVMMYGKCGSLEEARLVFEATPAKNVFSWTILITVCAQHGRSQEALALFYEMLKQGIQPHSVSFTAAINACSAGPEFLPAGRALHALLRRYGFQDAVVATTSLVSMYSKCGSLEESVKTFESMTELNAVSWNAMIAAFAEHRRGLEALRTLQKMFLEGIRACSVTYITLMSAYDQPSQLKSARYIHDCILRTGFDQDVVVGTTLVNMYAKCSGLHDANAAFVKLQEPNVITWNVLISAYVQHCCFKEAMGLFRRMLLLGLEMDEVTFINILGACCVPVALEDGRAIHACVREHPLASNHAPLENVILNMYGKCGCLQDAEAMFKSMSQPDVIAWNTMIAAYSQHGHTSEALRFYELMQEEGVVPDDYTYVSVIDACATLGDMEVGKQVHRRLGDRAFQVTELANSLVNMYGKCGILDVARSIFDKTAKGSVTWNAMIGAYAQHSHEQQAFELFLLMRLDGEEPSYITFMSVLSACANAGLPEEAHSYFVCMQQDHGVRPGGGHYGCMVESLGKAGRLSDAEALIQGMPFEPDVLTWTSFLANCRSHGDMKRGKFAAKGAIRIDPEASTGYVALARIHADAGDFQEASRIRKLMLDRGIRKNAGRSIIKLGTSVYEFTAGDQSNPRSKEIFDELKRLDKEMKRAGYDPDMTHVAHDVEAGQKEPLLFAHSERLAIAFGIISTSQGTPLRIMKNLRVCGDCHAMTKLTSKITRREIIVRDSNRFHHFKNGSCSCKDFW
ncbi:pentatricopeptide repeat-containing protein ELI1, chloroplastic [Selaginella moellendorffii]|uniref:pentatricopeptide repeat-containing protein ELI1, chloroplastic n=1 Tax=Selaginella moellendorffii TaxID=88036 RepID=UPI000D1CFEDF|nr:pentatricopeptide repeat-containing protein ELI1, chloroplastic [Selaginella moellendorffii]XP_024515351.1 pentatricopeptide repeat-containing protein ELI1, chloroplastic [Selaginella moellendorffii]|eukprot:XP_024515350.1 pentatricopeptide repeat-containing protein ELI1, chloroplastic [Selaginella moellendorffii]